MNWIIKKFAFVNNSKLSLQKHLLSVYQSQVKDENENLRAEVSDVFNNENLFM